MHRAILRTKRFSASLIVKKTHFGCGGFESTGVAHIRSKKRNGMIIGTVKEIKNHEYRVGMIPSAAKEYVAHGHQVLVQAGAGMGVGLTDELYKAAGAEIMGCAEDVFKKADLIVKVKEPVASEVKMLRHGQILYTYLHLAANRELTLQLQDTGAICVAYETVQRGNMLPLLLPMSEVAGRMSVQVGAHCLEKESFGKGQMLSGVPGVERGRVVILGGGVAGTNAARIAVGMGSYVTILDKSLERITILDQLFGSSVQTLYANTYNVERSCETADVIVGAVLIPGAKAPKLLTRQMLQRMEVGSVVIDISIDQGGCFETSRPTSHAEPTFVDEGIVHYCVTNMPGALAKTSTYALNNATLYYGLQLAGKGWKQAMRDDYGLLAGLNVAQGHVTHQAVAESLGMAYTNPRTVLGC